MIAEFCKRVLISEEDLLGRSRKQNIVDARHVYFLLLSKNGFTREKTGELCGFAHSTVTQGIKHVNALLGVGDEKITRLYNLTKDIKR